MNEQNERPNRPKIEKGQPQTAWLFDIDGVLTDPLEKKVTHPALFDELIKRLERQEPVALNTGRSLEFVNRVILKPLEKKIADAHILQNIFGIVEKGGLGISYDREEKQETCVDRNIRAPEDLKDEIRALAAKPPFSETMFYDETKQTMVSVELLPKDQMHGRSFEEFQEAQRALVVELQRLLSHHHLESSFRIDPSRIATDVQNKNVGKALGVRQFVEALRTRGVRPTQYLAFGDSESDYEMYEELKRLGLPGQLVYVGEQEALREKDLSGVVFTRRKVDQGTLEFLQNATKSV